MAEGHNASLRPVASTVDAPRTVALIVTPKYLPFLGGMERECALLAGELRRRGWQPVIVTEQLGSDAPLEGIDEQGVVVHRVPSSPERSLGVQLRVAARMARLVLRYRRQAAFAVVRTVTLPAVLLGLLKRMRILRIPTLATAETGGVADDVVALAERPLFALSRALVSAHDALNGICRANVEHLRAFGFPEPKITFIPNGVDTTAWHTARPPARIVRFLFLGRIEPSKGVHELIDAFAEVHARHAEARLIVAGEGESRAELEAGVAGRGLSDAVEFSGRVPYEELGALFERVDCLVLPSYSEGMPLSVLEAAAHRRPMILTDVGDMRELFGDRVRICPPRDAAALAHAMESAVADPAPRADYDDVIDRVAIERVADALLERLGVGRL